MFCLTELKNFSREFFCAVSQKNSGSEKIHGKGRGVGRVSRHSVECFCLTLPKKHVEESFTVSLTLQVPKIVGDRRGSRFHDFSMKFFCLREPNLFVREPLSALCLRKVPVAKMFLEETERDSIKTFHRTFFFVSQSRKFS